MRLSSGSKTLHTAEVSLSKAQNHKQQREHCCCKLWPLTLPSVEEGDVESLRGGHSLLVPLQQKTETAIVSRASLFYLRARLHPVCPIWSRCLQRVKGHKWSKDTEVKAPSAVSAAAAQTWSTYFWVQCVFGPTSQNWRRRLWLCLSHKTALDQDFNQRPTSSYVLCLWE